MNFFGLIKPKIGRDVDFSTLIPAASVSYQNDPDTGMVVLLVPRFRDPILGRYLQPRLPDHKRHIRIPLDFRGSHIWPLMDGQRSILALSQEFETKFPEDTAETCLRISAYLHRMFENKFIEFLNLD